MNNTMEQHFEEDLITFFYSKVLCVLVNLNIDTYSVCAVVVVRQSSSRRCIQRR